jgi:pilus assembly protein CpaB
VQGATPSASEEGETSTASAEAPDNALMVTLALVSRDVEQVVFGAEFGTLWLAREPEGADISGTQIVTPGNVYTESPR